MVQYVPEALLYSNPLGLSFYGKGYIYFLLIILSGAPTPHKNVSLSAYVARYFFPVLRLNVTTSLVSLIGIGRLELISNLIELSTTSYN